MTGSEEWEAVPDDPDPEANLGYRDEPLTVVRSATDSQFVFLPEHEPQVGEEEFIVATEGSLRDVER